MNVWPRHIILGLLISSASFALTTADRVKLNELYFAGSPLGVMQDGFVELYNGGDQTAYLDGAFIAQGLDTFAQLCFKFPGEPGDTLLPLRPSQYFVIAIDAHDFTGEDPLSLDLRGADFESTDSLELAPGDNPAVPNLDDALSIPFDWFFVPGAGQVLLATGEDFQIRPCNPDQACGSLVAVLDWHTIVDGVEYLRNLHDYWPQLNDSIDTGAIIGVLPQTGHSAERISPGFDTNHSTSDFVELSAPTPGFGTTAARPREREMPESFSFESVYPNPFNSSTSIRFTLARDEPVQLALFDLLGNHVRTLIDATMPAGAHSVQWNGAGAARELSSGVYFARLRAGGEVAVRKVVLQK
ncbi:T9SS type A sorting domain-containing protein [candidate division KSB1 bacterium]|nr:T9SS type A sorting domain-containing protein [candidate division KSB1 bacterium]